MNTQPKKSKTAQWNGKPKLRTRSPLNVHPSRTTLSNGQVRISKRILFRENKNYILFRFLMKN
jgi:hypothetical protein